MASPTKIVETIRSRKRAKRTNARKKRLRVQLKKAATKAPTRLKHLISGA